VGTIAADEAARGSPTGTPNHAGMGTYPPNRRSVQWVVRRLQHRGLRPRDAALVVCGFWAIAVVVFGVVERLVDPKSFHSVWLGMWWATETVTTVGYGDIIPDQTAGKVIAGFLMLGGLSLISVLTAVITSGFVALAQERRRAAGDDPVSQKLDAIAAELQALGARLDRLTPPAGPEDTTP
jgi:voltage-gated potassium channel